MNNSRTVQTDNAATEIPVSSTEKLVDILVDTATALAGDTLSKEEREEAKEVFDIVNDALKPTVDQI